MFGGEFVYRGDMAVDDKSVMMHGYGTCVWEPGARYDGCWAHGDRHGWGMMMYPDGTVVAGRWMYDELRWRSTLWLRDGKRCFVGDWNSVRVPVKGAMMEANGDVYYAENKDKLPIFHMEKGDCDDTLRLDGYMDCETAWELAVYSGLERKLVGRVVEGGAPVPDGGGGMRAARVELADGGTYIGPMRGLSYCSVGVMTDARGGAWRVISSESTELVSWFEKSLFWMIHAELESEVEADQPECTFAEGQEPVAKEVLLPEPLARWFSIHVFPSADSLPFTRAAAQAGGACGARSCAGRARRGDGGDVPVCGQTNARVADAARPLVRYS